MILSPNIIWRVNSLVVFILSVTIQLNVRSIYGMKPLMYLPDTYALHCIYVSMLLLQTAIIRKRCISFVVTPTRIKGVRCETNT